MRTVTVRLLGPLREVIGQQEIAVQIPQPCSAAELRRRLLESFLARGGEGLPIIETAAVATEDEIYPDSADVGSGECFMLLPPVSSG